MKRFAPNGYVVYVLFEWPSYMMWRYNNYCLLFFENNNFTDRATPLTIVPSCLGRWSDGAMVRWWDDDGVMTMARWYDNTYVIKRCCIAPSVSRRRIIVIALSYHVPSRHDHRTIVRDSIQYWCFPSVEITCCEDITFIKWIKLSILRLKGNNIIYTCA